MIFNGYLSVLKDTTISLLPLAIIFTIYQLFFHKTPKDKLINMLKGMFIAFIGLTLFIQGANAGYMPMGKAVGIYLGKSSYRFLLIPLGFVLGFCITLAEPSIRVLVSKIEEATGGHIKKKVMITTICIGVAFSIAISMIKVLYNIPIWYILVPGYILSLILTNFVSQEFTGIAFDSGGVATGTMSVTFLLSMAIGATSTIKGATALDGFGIIGIIALTPIISVLTLGIIYKIMQNNIRKKESQ